MFGRLSKQEEAIRKEEEREKERKRIECEKRALEEGLSEELRRVRQEAEKEMELMKREKLAAAQELAQVCSIHSLGRTLVSIATFYADSWTIAFILTFCTLSEV